ncbi:thymidylate synthase [Roseobacter phage CRP-603]|nr:thymidylate synthase [Roseobacter phage CRP-603]
MIEVTYVDHMGDDLSVVNAARVSFGKRSAYIYSGVDTNGPPEKYLDKKDDKLIRYLAKHKHKSPFNHAFATFHVKAPVFVARQLVKHEYMPWNEISRRYVDDPPDFFKPDYWRGRAENVKQGSSGEVKSNANVAYQYAKIEGLYKQLLDEGVCPEQARMILPQSMMTEWYWSGTLYAFAKMCGLRLKEDTQAETRVVAEKVEDVMAKLYPVSWEALRMYEE